MKQILFQYETSFFHIVVDCIFINIFLITVFLQFFQINYIFTNLFKRLVIFHKFPKLSVKNRYTLFKYKKIKTFGLWAGDTWVARWKVIGLGRKYESKIDCWRRT